MRHILPMTRSRKIKKRPLPEYPVGLYGNGLKPLGAPVAGGHRVFVPEPELVQTPPRGYFVEEDT
jgi:hypothetical protein